MRSFTEVECEQRSPEWFAARLGLVTGSAADDMLSWLKSGKESAGRRNLRVRLALERVVGRPVESDFQSAAMRQGIEREAEARMQYEVLTRTLTRVSGFLRHNDLAAGCSLDGHVGDYEGIVEIKCPIPATHLVALRTRTIPAEYLAQVKHNLFVTGAQWCDWLSYNPDFPPEINTVLLRVEFTEFDLMVYRRALEAFLLEVEQEELAIRNMVPCA